MKTLSELQEEIEKDFDEKFPHTKDAIPPDYWVQIKLQELKKFIREATEMVAREALRAIELKKKQIPEGLSSVLTRSRRRGFNEALTESERLKNEFLSPVKPS